MRRTWLLLLLGCIWLCANYKTASADTWQDPSPHKVLFVEVEPGVRLEVLDWGGTGEAVVLLAGHGDTGHVFDVFAPQLARHYHVIAITRRGFGASSQPEGGYDLARLAEDVVSVADSLGIQKFSVIGHSIAGDEMNRLAVMVPGRVLKLVYVEAAYDRVASNQMEVGFRLPHPLEQPSTDDLASPEALTRYIWKTECPGMPEAEVRATRVFAADGHFDHAVTSDEIVRKVAGMVEHPSYDQIHSPALAIYAVKKTPAQLFSVFATEDNETQAALKNIFVQEVSFQKSQREKFAHEMKNGKVVEIPGGNHYVFISNQTEVLNDVVHFLSH